MEDDKEIKIIKLVSGEELIGLIEIPEENYSEENYTQTKGDDFDFSNIVVIKAPLRVKYEYDNNKIPHVYLLDWIPGSDQEDYFFHISHILTDAIPKKELEELYYTVLLSRSLEENPNVDITKEEKERTFNQILNSTEFDEDDKQ